MAITKISPYEMGDYHSFGQNVGKSFGAGINHAVSGLAQAKLNTLLAKQQKQDQWHEREQAYTQAVAGGLSPEDARIVASAAPEDRINYWKILAGSRRSPEAGQNPMSSEMGGPQQQEQQSLQQLLQQGGQQGNGQDAVMQNLMKLLGGQQGQQMMQQSQSPQQVNQMLQPNAQTSQQGQMTTAEKFAGYETPEMKLRRELADKKESGANQRAIDKANQPYIDEIYSNADKAEAQNRILDEMDSLAENPKALGGPWGEYLKRSLGIAEGSGSSASQLYRAYESRLIDGVRGVYGNRIPVEEMRIFARRIPSLINSPEGRRVLSESLRKVNNDEILKRDTANSLLDSNEGKSTRLFKRDLSKKYNEELNKRAKSFSDNIKKANKIPLSGTMEKRPAAHAVPKGTISTDYMTGKKEISNGKSWSPYKG